MAPVSMILHYKGQVITLGKIEEETITKHSTLARISCEEQSGDDEKVVHIMAGSPGPLKHVLSMIERAYSRLPSDHIRVHREPLDRAVMIFEAVEALRIDPPQPKIEGHIVGWLSHHMIKPHEMLAVHHAFEERQDSSRAWKVMVHQMAWDFTHGKYEVNEADALENSAKPYPELHQAVTAKIHDLERRQTNYNEASARWAARKAAKKEHKEQQQVARVEQQRKAFSIYRRVADYHEQKHWEETHGMKEASESTVNWVKNSKGGSHYFGPPKNQLRKAMREKARIEEQDEA